MTISTVTDKGQTTVPLEVRQALKVEPRQRLEWIIQEDGTVVVRPQKSALDLFGSLKSTKRFQSREAERKSVMESIGVRVTGKGKE